MDESNRIVGRDAELELVGRFLSRDADALPAALVIEGEAGIGKTLLWREGLERARTGTATVMATTLTVGETRLAFAGLADLVGDIWDDVAAELPAPQRAALEHALLLRQSTRSLPDERAVAFGFLGLLRILASQCPLTIAIDDVQWLDPSSASMLGYALRRLHGEPVRFLIARRLDEGGAPDPLQLDRAHGVAVESIPIGPLTLGALHRLLRVRLGHSLTRPALSRIHTASSGNPLHALELSRALETSEGATPGSLPALMQARVMELPDETRRVLLLAALAADPSLSTLSRAGVVEPADALAAALAAELIVLPAGVVRFSHPLVATAVVETCSESEQRTGHRLLALAAATDEERARHLGRAATGPSEEIALALEDAAELARRRGATATSAELYEEAAALTPADDATRRARRMIDAAYALVDAGEAERAREILHLLVNTAPEGPERVEARWRLGTVLDETGHTEEAMRLWHDALDATEDARMTAELHRSLAYTTVYVGSASEAARHADASADAAERSGDTRTLIYALGAQALIAVLRGSPDFEQPLDRALALEAELDERLKEWSPTAVAAECGRLTGGIEQAREAYETVLAQSIDVGDVTGELWALFGLCSTELLAGRLDRAGELGEVLLELADQTGLMRIPTAGLAGTVTAHAGDLNAARASVLAALAEAQAAHERMYEFNILQGLGFIEASLDDHGAAAVAYGRACAVAAALGTRHVPVLRSFLHESEEAAAAGLLEQAEAALAEYATAAGPPFEPLWLANVSQR